MQFNINELVTEAEANDCRIFAESKVNQKLSDAKTNPKAGCSNGSLGESRPYEVQLEHNYMGNLAELIASKLLKTEWLKATQQYFNKKIPDLQPIFKGKSTKCAVRGTKRKGFVIYRQKRDRNIPSDELLVGITNLPFGPECEIVYSTFGEIKKICEKHPEWLDQKHTNSPIYWVPTSYFIDDFSVFGDK